MTEEKIKQMSTPQSFERGVRYYNEGAVYTPRRQKQTLRATVQGTRPYQVTLTLNQQNEASSARCTCPYEFGGWCKHIVALALMFTLEPDKFIEQPDLPEQLSHVSKENLVEVISSLLDHKPEIRPYIEIEINFLLKHFDAAPYEQLVQMAINLLQDYESNSQWEATAVFDAVISSTRRYIKNREFDHAIAILRLMGDGLMQDDELLYLPEIDEALDEWSMLLYMLATETDIPATTQVEVKAYIKKVLPSMEWMDCAMRLQDAIGE
jgi:hypothetical protein